MLAMVLPFVMQHVFRTTGHHWLSNMAAAYQDKYNRVLSACLITEAFNIMPGELMCHAAIHWVQLGRVAAMLEVACLPNSPIRVIPDAIKTRAGASPAGCALISTTSAVLKNMESAAFYPDVYRRFGAQINQVHDMAAEISHSPYKYHKSVWAFNSETEVTGLTAVALLTDAESIAFDASKDAAAMMSALCQAYIDAYARGGSLSRAMALKKHADDHVADYRTIRAWLRRHINTLGAAGSLGDILTGAIQVPNVVAAPAVVDEEED